MTTQDPLPSKKRSRGAGQKGFYSPRFRLDEVEDLSALPGGDLRDEIAMLRVATRRVMELADGVESLGSAIKVLNALGTASTRLAGLLKTQKELANGGSQVSEAISQALAQVAKEMNLK